MSAPSIPRTWWCFALLSVGAAAILPYIGHRLRRTPERRCALDGAEVNASIMVQIVTTPANDRLQFCSLFCAERWLEASGARPAAIFVTDEATGNQLPSAAAFYVRSSVIAHAPTGERRHVFAALDDAQKHADEHFGRVLEGNDRPFSARPD